MTTFFSFTADGGQIGRLRWFNSRRPAAWGRTFWDPWWPGAAPLPTRLERIARLLQDAALAAEALRPSVEQASRAIAELGAAFARAAAQAGSLPGRPPQ